MERDTKDKLRILAVLALGAAISGLSGCAIPESAAQRLRDRTGAADGVLREWDNLTPGQRKVAAHKLRRGYHAIRWELLDEPPGDATIRAELERLARKGAPGNMPGSPLERAE